MPILIIGQCVSIFTEIRSKKKAHTEKSKKMSHTTSTVLSFLCTHTHITGNLSNWINLLLVCFFGFFLLLSIHIYNRVKRVTALLERAPKCCALYSMHGFSQCHQGKHIDNDADGNRPSQKRENKGEKKQSTTTVLRNMRNLLTLSHERVKDKLVY